MKNIIAVFTVASMSLISANIVFAAMNAGTGVQGSMHDMNVIYTGNQDKMGRVCVFCHTPHNADMGTQAAGSYPLWNHTLPPTTGWTSFVWATPLNKSLTISDPMIGPTRLCMSCHDGVLAPDSHEGTTGGNIAQTGSGPLTGFKAIGLRDGVSGTTYDLTDDHPIGFSYDDAVIARNTTGTNATNELVDKTLAFATAIGTTNTAGTYNAPVRNGKRRIQDVLFNGVTMTCASCHEVHNKDNVAPSVNNSGGTVNYLLWADENYSLICLSCHIK